MPVTLPSVPTPRVNVIGAPEYADVVEIVTAYPAPPLSLYIPVPHSAASDGISASSKSFAPGSTSAREAFSLRKAFFSIMGFVT